jgi:tetratricopeptide (TPR) repeat protein
MLWGVIFVENISYSFGEENLARKESEDSFYSFEYPEKRMEFWESVSHCFTHLKFKETLEKLKEINEFSDKNDLSLLEFRNYIAIKYLCLNLRIQTKNHTSKYIKPDILKYVDPDDGISTDYIIKYLDKLVDHTRKSKRWQKDKFVMEYFFSLAYALIGEYKKADEALNRFIIADEMLIHLVQVVGGKNRRDWMIFENAGNSFVAYYHAACVYAALEKYDDAIKLCDDLLRFDIDSNPDYSKDVTVVNHFYAMLERVGIKKESFKMFMNEVRKKRQCFTEKKDWTYHCKPILVSDQDNPDEICRGFQIYLRWNRKNKINNTETEDFDFPVFYFNLIPTEINEDEINILF